MSTCDSSAYFFFFWKVKNIRRQMNMFSSFCGNFVYILWDKTSVQTVGHKSIMHLSTINGQTHPAPHCSVWRTELNSAQGQHKGHRQAAVREIPARHQEENVAFEGEQTLEHVAYRSCGTSTLGDSQTRYLIQVVLCWERCWTNWPLEFIS